MIYLVTPNKELFDNDTYKIMSVEESLKLLEPLKVVGLDSETSSLRVHEGKLLSLQLGCLEFQVVIDCLTIDILLYKEYLESNRLFVGHNLKFDLQWLFLYHIVPQKIYDTYSKEPEVKRPKKGIKRKEMQGNVEFRNVSYEVEGEDIIQDISFSVGKGQTIGILGSTGAGKSTIMNLLCRFYDVTKGEVLVDGINVRDWDLHDLRDNIGMAMQDVFLFSDTIEGNIAYGKPDCSFEEVKEAAVMSDANLFIKAMPEGYDTVVGERGVGLSGGQKQRISLARALLKRPSILILDDTTSAVDMETESYIQDQLKKLGKKHTIFVLAYRISSIKDADMILVMEEGHIVERGNHESLLKENGYYATVYRHQNGLEG